jgi:hypothetical protein
LFHRFFAEVPRIHRRGFWFADFDRDTCKRRNEFFFVIGIVGDVVSENESTARRVYDCLGV